MNGKFCVCKYMVNLWIHESRFLKLVTWVVAISKTVQPEKQSEENMTFDSSTVMPYPTQGIWANLYAKSHKAIAGMLNHSYSRADREDAVEVAFERLMYKKNRESYGDGMPQTEAEWVRALYWQARAYLSHLREHGECHARYVKKTSEEFADVFAQGHQGEALDADICARALRRALETFCEEQGVARRNLGIFVALTTREASVREVAKRHHISEGNVYVIKSRVGELLRKHGPRHFENALAEVGGGEARQVWRRCG